MSSPQEIVENLPRVQKQDSIMDKVWAELKILSSTVNIFKVGP